MSDDKLMDLTILTPSETLYVGKVKKVKIPGEKSPFQVLYNHAPILSTLSAGTIVCVDSEEKTTVFNISGGVVEVLNNAITITGEEISKIVNSNI